MAAAQIALVLFGALAGGIVNGLTGFGTAITAMGIWLYALEPTAAASLAIVCAAVAQLQTLPMIWPAMRWRRILPLVVPGIFGVPIGTWLLPHVDPRLFRIGIGAFLVIYSSYVLTRRTDVKSDWGGVAAEGAAGFGGGILGGLTGLSGVLPVVVTDFRGWPKDQRRAVIQAFNVAILALALISHAVSGLLTREVGLAIAIALPCTIGGAWLGGYLYRRLHDHSYQRLVMMLLFVSGVMLIWASR